MPFLTLSNTFIGFNYEEIRSSRDMDVSGAYHSFVYKLFLLIRFLIIFFPSRLSILLTYFLLLQSLQFSFSCLFAKCLRCDGNVAVVNGCTWKGNH